LTLWDRVGPVVVNPRARVVHLESLTTSDSRMRLESQVEINRLGFVDKWGAWLSSKQAFRPSTGDASVPHDRDRRNLPPEKAPAVAPKRKERQRGIESAVLFTPYELIPGGGERVLFELASVLVNAIGADNVKVASPFKYSNLRMTQLSDVFDVDGPDSC